MILDRNSCRGFYRETTEPGSASLRGGLVSRETALPRGSQTLFPVKHVSKEMNEEIVLFSNTKVPENGIKDMLDVDPAKQPPQGSGRSPQILGDEFLTLSRLAYAASQQ